MQDTATTETASEQQPACATTKRTACLQQLASHSAGTLGNYHVRAESLTMLSFGFSGNCIEFLFFCPDSVENPMLCCSTSAEHADPSKFAVLHRQRKLTIPMSSIGRALRQEDSISGLGKDMLFHRIPAKFQESRLTTWQTASSVIVHIELVFGVQSLSRCHETHIAPKTTWWRFFFVTNHEGRLMTTVTKAPGPLNGRKTVARAQCAGGNSRKLNGERI